MAKTKASKSLGTLLVIIGIILFLIICAQFIWRLLLALGALYVIGRGLEMRGSAPLPVTVNVWVSKIWGSMPRHHK